MRNKVRAHVTSNSRTAQRKLCSGHIYGPIIPWIQVAGCVHLNVYGGTGARLLRSDSRRSSRGDVSAGNTEHDVIAEPPLRCVPLWAPQDLRFWTGDSMCKTQSTSDTATLAQHQLSLPTLRAWPSGTAAERQNEDGKALQVDGAQDSLDGKPVCSPPTPCKNASSGPRDSWRVPRQCTLPLPSFDVRAALNGQIKQAKSVNHIADLLESEAEAVDLVNAATALQRIAMLSKQLKVWLLCSTKAGIDLMSEFDPHDRPSSLPSTLKFTSESVHAVRPLGTTDQMTFCPAVTMGN
jgi:hypothetical protein